MATDETGPGPEMRETDGGDRISVKVLREYLIWVIHHDAVYDNANDLIFDHVAGGYLHPAVAVVALRELVSETIEAATVEDWHAVFDALVSDARESVPELGSRSPDSSELRRLRHALRAIRGLWKGTAR
jgi:hypothetical protein